MDRSPRGSPSSSTRSSGCLLMQSPAAPQAPGRPGACTSSFPPPPPSSPAALAPCRCPEPSRPRAERSTRRIEAESPQEAAQVVRAPRHERHLRDVALDRFCRQAAGEDPSGSCCPCRPSPAGGRLCGATSRFARRDGRARGRHPREGKRAIRLRRRRSHIVADGHVADVLQESVPCLIGARAPLGSLGTKTTVPGRGLAPADRRRCQAESQCTPRGRSTATPRRRMPSPRKRQRTGSRRPRLRRCRSRRLARKLRNRRRRFPDWHRRRRSRWAPECSCSRRIRLRMRWRRRPRRR